MSNQFIDTLSEEWILYIIDPVDLALFQTVATEFEQIITPYIPPALEQINIYVTVCNIWFTLQSHQKPLYLDETRRMAYISAYIQLEFVERHKDIKQFIQTHRLNHEGLFYLAFFISIACMNWVTKVMTHAEQEEILAYYMQDENFLKSNASEDCPNFNQTLDFQKIYVKEMIKNLKNTNELNDAMKVAMNQTREILKKQSQTQEQKR